MKVMLLQDVKKLGKAGEIVEISDGYAKNFILPKKLGKEATNEVLNEWKLKKGSEANRKLQERQEALATAAELSSKSVVLQVKGGENGRLFGAVTAKDIAEALDQQHGVKIDKKKIQLKEAIKTVGNYEVEIKLHPVASAKIAVKVEANE
ncbi:MAG: 50S ribosomal protein L9 [Firmicutes bacterium]|nr:50S ribosomal protein L9 [Bacillota bacterium]